MLLFIKEGSKPVLVGEKGVYVGSIHRAMVNRGYTYTGSFYASWNTVSKEFTILYDTKTTTVWMDEIPLTVEARLEMMTRHLVKLESKSETLEKKVHTLEMEG